MTEPEWLNCTDPQTMLELLRDRSAELRPVPCSCCCTRCLRRRGFCPAYRKLRLFACACCRPVMNLLPDAVCHAALGAAEQHAEGALDEAAFVQVAEDFDIKRRARFPRPGGFDPDDHAWNALYCAVHRRWRSSYDDTHATDRWRIAAVIAYDAVQAHEGEEASEQAALLREVFGNPFRLAPPVSAPVLLWDDGTVPKLARAIYEEWAFDRLPILGDALEESGCTDAALLGHCRQPGGHVRGCWALDLLLGTA
jgi:hypothetical protein